MAITVKEAKPKKRGFKLGDIVIHSMVNMIGIVGDNNPYGYDITWTDGSRSVDRDEEFKSAKLFHGTITVD